MLLPRRSPYGERGLKLPGVLRGHEKRRRSPYGERGLKLGLEDLFTHEGQSLPLRGAWIEIRYAAEVHADATKSLPLRGAWIEILRSN